MTTELLHYCPKCGSTELVVESEPGQYTVLCRSCHLYCEIIIFDEGNN